MLRTRVDVGRGDSHSLTRLNDDRWVVSRTNNKRRQKTTEDAAGEMSEQPFTFRKIGTLFFEQKFNEYVGILRWSVSCTWK